MMSMSKSVRLIIGTSLLAVIILAFAFWRIVLHPEEASLSIAQGTGPLPILPKPNETLMPTVNIATPIGWKGEEQPVAASGLAVNAYARGMKHPRWMYTLPNGDILVAETNGPGTDKSSLKNNIARLVQGHAGAGEKSPDRIILLRDSQGKGIADIRSIFLEHLHSPFGMALIGNDLYVANADALMKFTYHSGQTKISEPGQKVIDLPSGYNHHWTKNILASPDHQTLYITVGSNSNVGENGLDVEKDRAMIYAFDIATAKLTPYATGLRNPNGLAWEPETNILWTVVNERDEIGSDLVPDYITSVKKGGFYGWPYSYYGQHVDNRVQPQRPDLVAQALVPDYALGPHTASLGIVFSMESRLPNEWRHGLFVSQHGSWNRRPKSGYKVVYVAFQDGHPMGMPRDVLTGFLTKKENYVHGRPVGLVLDKKGDLLVADDVGGVIWRVSAKEAQTTAP